MIFKTLSVCLYVQKNSKEPIVEVRTALLKICRLFDAHLPPKAYFKNLQKLNLEFRENSEYVGHLTTPLKDGIGTYIVDITSLDKVLTLTEAERTTHLLAIIREALVQLAADDTQGRELVTQICDTMLKNNFIHEKTIEKLCKLNRKNALKAEVVVRTDLEGEHVLVRLLDANGNLLTERYEGSSSVLDFYKQLARASWDQSIFRIFQKTKHEYTHIDFSPFTGTPH